MTCTQTKGMAFDLMAVLTYRCGCVRGFGDVLANFSSSRVFAIKYDSFVSACPSNYQSLRKECMVDLLGILSGHVERGAKDAQSPKKHGNAVAGKCC
jgi:hypothetical protein